MYSARVLSKVAVQPIGRKEQAANTAQARISGRPSFLPDTDCSPVAFLFFYFYFYFFCKSAFWSPLAFGLCLPMEPSCVISTVLQADHEGESYEPA